MVYFGNAVRFRPQRDEFAVLVFGNEVVYCVLGDVWGRGHPRRLGLRTTMLAFICMYNSVNEDVRIQFIL